jgi:ATP-binding protein involved in chromosome partitioning
MRSRCSPLSTIIDPDFRRDVVSLGMIKDLSIQGGTVSFTFELTTPACPVKDRFQALAEEKLRVLPGVSEVRVRMTSNVCRSRRFGERILPGVRQRIAVASGKGGVGKSTVAVNLAAGLGLTGARVGLLDADIYGPSVPAMVGARAQPVVRGERLGTVEDFGVQVMSTGLLARSDRAMVWRGPMVSRAIEQMLGDVAWGELDYLVIDLPPGTEDASLTLAQQVPLTGVAIVCTPQEVALQIAVKALRMFRQLNVPFLGAIPLDEGVREEADAGSPVVVARPGSLGTSAFRELVSQVAARAAVLADRELPAVSVR